MREITMNPGINTGVAELKKRVKKENDGERGVNSRKRRQKQHIDKCSAEV